MADNTDTEDRVRTIVRMAELGIVALFSYGIFNVFASAV